MPLKRDDPIVIRAVAERDPVGAASVLALQVSPLPGDRNFAGRHRARRTPSDVFLPGRRQRGETLSRAHAKRDDTTPRLLPFKLRSRPSSMRVSE
jgi:hypothetical protein